MSQAPVSTSSGRQQRERLAELVARASRLRGLRGLSEEELLEFGRLYRRAASELSHARAYGLDTAELEYLNRLVGRAYGLLYVSERTGWSGVGRFLRAELPQTIRHHGRLAGLCTALFAAPALIGALVSLLRPDFLELVNPDLAAVVEAITRRHHPGADWLPTDFRPLASSLIIVNNIQVSFLAFSTGVLVGLGTALVLIYNGLLLGTIAAAISRSDACLHFWAFVAPHGVIELPAIIISAAAGLLLARALLDPGEHSRLDALRLAGRQAAVLMLGVLLFLAVAGLVEGLFSPGLAPPAVKFLGAAFLGTGFWGYLLLAGRASGRPAVVGRRPSPPTAGPV